MNNTEKELIFQLLKGKEDLICDYMFKCSYNVVKKILEMEEWNEERFQPLLTSSIWISNYENIKSKLHLSCWNNYIYEKLLTPTIFAIKKEYILVNIKLFEEFGIEKFITVRSLRKNPNDQRILIEYLIENKIDLVIDMKLNPIINATKKILKEEYKIDINELKKGRKK